MRWLPLVLCLFVSGVGAGCSDDCAALADVICQCEPSLAERESCRVELEAQQNNQPIGPSEAQLEACRAALDTCTCAGLDENRTDQCGFTRAAGSGSS
jgi:hypothetical protein